jgi:2-dehydropantoate 2-reductase
MRKHMNAGQGKQPQRDRDPNSDTASTRSLRIAVIGLGGIGSAFAFQLARVGSHDVTAVARPNSSRLDQLQRDNGIVDVNGNPASLCAVARLDEAIPYDLVILAMPAYHIDAVLPGLKRSVAKNILFMFNTFEPERLRDAVGAERCSFGMPFIQAFVDGNGKLNATIGAAGQRTKIDHPGWVEVFKAVGLPAVLEPNMLLWLRCHVPLCIGFESVSVAGMRRGGGASWGETMMIARGVKESFTLIRRLGYQLYPPGKARLADSPAWVVAGMLWSVSRIPSFRKLLATGIGECRALVDVLLANAERVSPPVSEEKIRAMKPLPDDR